MKITVRCGNILDEPADVLVCSANCLLNLSGGVGGELLSRYGMMVQTPLHELLRERTPRVAKPGEVFVMSDPRLPYKAVLHAVAVDGWYRSSPELCREVVTLALEKAAQLGAKRVALTALATGFGDMGLAGFGKVMKEFQAGELPPIGEVVVCLEEEERAQELTEAMQAE